MSISPRTSSLPHDRHDDLRLRLDAAREIPRIGVHVVDDDRRFLRRGGAADAAAERDARVRRRLADERAEHELVAVEQVDADPVVVRHGVLQQRGRSASSPPARSGDGGDRRADRVQELVMLGRRSFLDLPEDQREPAEQRHQLQRGREPVQPSELDAARIVGRAGSTARRRSRPAADAMRRRTTSPL